MKKSKGNSLLEYILPAVIFFGVGALAFTFGNLDERFSDFFVDTTHGKLEGTTVAISSLGSILPPQSIVINANSLPPAAGAQLETVCFNSGLCITAPVLNDTAGTETAGGLGNDETRALANVLTQLAKQMEAANEDPAIVNLINQLANQGHDLSDSIDVIATTCPNGTCSTTNMAVINPLFSAVVVEKDEFNTTFSDLKTWFTQNPNALSTFPEAEQIIIMEAEEIQKLANGINKTQSNTSKTTSTQEKYYHPRFGQRKRKGPSVTTTVKGNIKVGSLSVDLIHQNSNDICSKGGEGRGRNSCYRRKDSGGEWDVIQK